MDVSGVESGAQGRLVGLGQLGLLGELLVQPLQRGLHRPAVEPVHQAQGVEVLAAQDVLLGQGAVGQGLADALVDVQLDDAAALEGAVLERVRRQPRLLQVALGEAAGVDDDHAAGLQVLVVDDQRGRVHGHEHVGGVARGVDVQRAEVDLVARDAGARARGGADLGGEVGEGGQVVAELRGGVGELAAGDLHAVAGIAGKTDDDVVLADGVGFVLSHGCCALASSVPAAAPEAGVGRIGGRSPPWMPPPDVDQGQGTTALRAVPQPRGLFPGIFRLVFPGLGRRRAGKFRLDIMIASPLIRAWLIR